MAKQSPHPRPDAPAFNDDACNDALRAVDRTGAKLGGYQKKPESQTDELQQMRTFLALSPSLVSDVRIGADKGGTIMQVSRLAKVLTDPAGLPGQPVSLAIAASESERAMLDTMLQSMRERHRPCGFETVLATATGPEPLDLSIAPRLTDQGHVDGFVLTGRPLDTLRQAYAELLMLGRDPRDVRVTTPRICGIRSISQSTAAAQALADAMGLMPTPQGALAAALTHAAENAADHLTFFHLIFMPHFARTACAGKPWHRQAVDRFTALQGGAQRSVIAARTDLLHVTGLMAGKWHHTLAVQPGGVTRAPWPSEKSRLATILRAFRRDLKGALFGGRLENFVALSTPAARMHWSGGDVALSIAADLGLAKMGRGGRRSLNLGAHPGHIGPAFARGVWAGGPQEFDPSCIVEDLSHAWRTGPAAHPTQGPATPDETRAAPGNSWCKAPRLAGMPMETGALARHMVHGHPLAIALANPGGVLARAAGWLRKLARTPILMESMVARLAPGASFMAQGPVPRHRSGAGLVGAARGALGHWLQIERDRIARYRIIPPITSIFRPHDATGPLKAARVGAVDGPDEVTPISVQRIMRRFDRCTICTVQ